MEVGGAMEEDGAVEVAMEVMEVAMDGVETVGNLEVYTYIGFLYHFLGK